LPSYLAKQKALLTEEIPLLGEMSRRDKRVAAFAERVAKPQGFDGRSFVGEVHEPPERFGFAERVRGDS